MTTLKVNDKAPDFEAKNQNGEIIKLSDYKGKKVILYFYPQDNTPTCTTEACNFRDNHSKLQKKGYTVIGVSPDSERKHQNFINKFELPFTLISDKDLTVANAYGVWGPKKFMGKTSDAIHRETFVIDEEGNIEKVIEKVVSKKATDQVLEEA